MTAATRMRDLTTDVLIIGAGVTGAGVMRDLALRGIRSILIDRHDLNAGASGGNHGLLHSGARYVSQDIETAAECYRENQILRRIAPSCIDPCGGMFVAVEGDDTAFAARFPDLCRAAGIPCEPLTPTEARRQEPALSDHVIAAYAVPDGAIDPFRLTLENVRHAQSLTDSLYLSHLEATDVDIAQDAITAITCRDTRSGAVVRITAKQVVNASGAWAMNVARMAGCRDVDLVYAKGTLVISNTRLTQGVVNRLRPPGDGDILVPGGTVSLLGTSSDTVDSPDGLRPEVAEVDHILGEGMRLVPELADTRLIRAFSGVRPLLKPSEAEGDSRQARRSFTLFDHESQGLTNFATVTGGKLTTFRLMAEKTGDLVARRLGVSTPSRSATTPLPTDMEGRWTEPGYAARNWFKRQDPTDIILCECEMVPRSSVDDVLDAAPGAGAGAETAMTLSAVARRSRIGKGVCQGAFCAIRATSYLYDRGVYDSPQGLASMRDFVTERFKGLRPVLWKEQVAQTELAEILHRGLMGLDDLDDLDEGGAP